MATIEVSRKILQLSPEVVNQIAAGEVVERPAHMVKEIVENSIDAGATKIVVEFAQGGKWLKVTDNGLGISCEDLPLTISRHATSKIFQSEDLWDLQTFGFRGEALASIAAVSEMEITSRTKEQNDSYVIRSEFGHTQDIKPVGGDVGTRVFIKGLFENLPARQKFLKSDAAEHSQIKNVLKALAMANPEVEFRVHLNGELIYFWPPCESAKLRVEQILEHHKLYYGEGACGDIRARVCISAPNETQRTSRQIWLFAQNRWIQDRALQSAVLDAYRSLLMHGEFPVAAVWVESPRDAIDVNVHPTKSQVKFQKPSDAFRAVHRAVHGILQEAPWLEGVTQASVEVTPPKSSEIRFVEAGASTGGAGNLEFTTPDFKVTSYAKKSFSEPFLKFEEFSEKVMEARSKVDGSTTQIMDSLELKVHSSDRTRYWATLEVVGQVGLTYLVCQNQDSMVLIDQHAAHERVAYERIMERWKTGQIEIQSLLVPLSISLPPEQVEKLVEQAQEILNLGLHLEASGPEHILVSAHPALVKESAVKKVVEILGEELAEKGGSFALEKHLSHLAATLACHSVVRAGQALSLEEMNSLLVQMDEFPQSSFCPHGRPVYIEWPLSKIEKEFGRIP